MRNTGRNTRHNFEKRNGFGGPHGNDIGSPYPYTWGLAGPRGAWMHFWIPQGESISNALPAIKEAARTQDCVELSWDYFPDEYTMRPARIARKHWNELADEEKARIGGKPHVYATEGTRTGFVPVTIDTPAERLNVVRRVVREKQYQDLRFIQGNGEVCEQALDLFSANSILQMYQALNRENRRKWFGMSWTGIFNIYLKLL